jgi:ATP-dependent Clp protease ATP-binding subunit ClpA
LTDEAREWLADNGYDEAMGARPMGRLIQSTIKTPLADEVLFGRLKHGGAVRVVVVASETTGLKVLGFEFPAGPATPKPEKDVQNAGKKPKVKAAGAAAGKAKSKAGPKGLPKLLLPPEDGGKPRGGIRTVPKVPLVKG